MTTLGEDYPKMQARVREILLQYKEIGPAGIFGAIMIEDLLQRADKAAIEQDLPAMISIYAEMKEIK
jgi:phosphoserine aminotransferase